MDDWDTLIKKLYATFETQNFNGNVKFSFKEGRNVHIFGDGSNVEIKEDSDVDATADLKMKMKDADAIVNRRMSPMKAIAMMRLKVRGDMSMAIKVAGFFSKPLPSDLA